MFHSIRHCFWLGGLFSLVLQIFFEFFFCFFIAKTDWEWASWNNKVCEQCTVYYSRTVCWPVSFQKIIGNLVTNFIVECIWYVGIRLQYSFGSVLLSANLVYGMCVCCCVCVWEQEQNRIAKRRTKKSLLRWKVEVIYQLSSIQIWSVLMELDTKSCIYIQWHIIVLIANTRCLLCVVWEATQLEC